MQCKGYDGWDLNKAISKIRRTTRLPSPLKIFPDGRSSTFTQQESKAYRISRHPNRFQSKQYGATEEPIQYRLCFRILMRPVFMLYYSH